ncbi:DoxX family protein [Anaeromyxobacter terrae]|uniref:DoxX family protein n=1 Tax=Anaeromyxobacter terrae TaxID=2925406 RepID=UPI001F58809D|nr:DoxX family protein [Anaeromyxobacter sp. SG22]
MSASAAPAELAAAPARAARHASRKGLWAGRSLSAFAALFLALDGVIKLLVPEPVVESMARLGYPVGLARGIGALELALLAVYLAPRTSVLGAILLTGYLGGAVSTHVRVGDPLVSHVLFPVYVGALLWGGLFLREARLRALVPSRRDLT